MDSFLHVILWLNLCLQAHVISLIRVASSTQFILFDLFLLISLDEKQKFRRSSLCNCLHPLKMHVFLSVCFEMQPESKQADFCGT